MQVATDSIMLATTTVSSAFLIQECLVDISLPSVSQISIVISTEKIKLQSWHLFFFCFHFTFCYTYKAQKEKNIVKKGKNFVQEAKRRNKKNMISCFSISFRQWEIGLIFVLKNAWDKVPAFGLKTSYALPFFFFFSINVLWNFHSWKAI